MNTLFDEVRQRFEWSMNSLMLRKCLLQASEDVIPHDLVAINFDKPLPQYYGLPLKNTNSK